MLRTLRFAVMALLYITTMACLADFAYKTFSSSSEATSDTVWPVFALPYVLLHSGALWRDTGALTAWLAACASIFVPICLTALYVKYNAQRLMWIALVAFTAGMAFYSIWDMVINCRLSFASQITFVAFPCIIVAGLIVASVFVSLLCNRRLIHAVDEEPAVTVIAEPPPQHQPVPMAPPAASSVLFDPFGDIMTKPAEIPKLAQARAESTSLFDPFAEFPKQGEDPHQPHQPKEPETPIDPFTNLPKVEPQLDPFTNLPKVEPQLKKSVVPEWDPFGSPST